MSQGNSPIPLSLQSLPFTQGNVYQRKTSSSTTTHAREGLQLFAGNEIANAYFEVFGRKMLTQQLEDVTSLIVAGMDVQVIVAAIEETAAAPSPSWRYAMAILRRCAAGKITTMEAWRADKHAWNGRKASRQTALEQPKKHVSQQCYTQRPYTPEETMAWEKRALDDLMRDFEHEA